MAEGASVKPRAVVDDSKGWLSFQRSVRQSLIERTDRARDWNRTIQAEPTTRTPAQLQFQPLPEHGWPVPRRHGRQGATSEMPAAGTSGTLREITMATNKPSPPPPPPRPPASHPTRDAVIGNTRKSDTTISERVPFAPAPPPRPKK